MITKTIENNHIVYRNDKGQYHNINAPALIWNDGSEWYYENGQLHNLHGPAIVDKFGNKGYFINGMEFSERNYYGRIRIKCPDYLKQ